jgi:D-alanine-D-alanine ligase
VTGLVVAVVCGGANAEHDVSLASARAVIGALGAAGHRVVEFTISREGEWTASDGTTLSLASAVGALAEADVVWPLVHGRHGEDGTLAALCELARVPYVGCGVAAGALAFDKAATKAVAATAGIAVARGMVVRSTAQATWRGPCVVKPVSSGSSVGVTLVLEEHCLADAIDRALEHDTRVLVEERVHGREIDVAVMDLADGTRLVAPPLEVLATGLFDYEQKYSGADRLRLADNLTARDRAALTDAAIAVYNALDCEGLARVDFFLTDAGVVLNEVNTVPGMGLRSQFPRMMAAAGLDYPQLTEAIVHRAMAHRVTNARRLADA